MKVLPDELDLTISYRTLAEVDRLIEADKEMIAEQQGGGNWLPWWRDRLRMHEYAREIMEYCLEENIDIEKPLGFQEKIIHDYRTGEIMKRLVALRHETNQLKDELRGLAKYITSKKDTYKEEDSKYG